MSCPALIAFVVAGAAHADAHDQCPLSYEVFEVSVPDTDLETCPDAMGLEEAFCRVSVVAEIATVFAFSEEDECLISARNFFEDEFSMSFE